MPQAAGGRIPTLSIGENPFRSGRRSFTLVEILVVAAAIGVLLSMLLPALAKARETGWRTKSASNMRQIGVMTGLYLAEHQMRFPPNGTVPWWQGLYPAYGSSPGVFRSPADRWPVRVEYHKLSYGEWGWGPVNDLSGRSRLALTHAENSPLYLEDPRQDKVLEKNYEYQYPGQASVVLYPYSHARTVVLFADLHVETVSSNDFFARNCPTTYAGLPQVSSP